MAAAVISTGNRYESLPEHYKISVLQWPNLSQVVKEEILLIDLGCGNRAEIVRKIGEACRLDGIFQVINHGISGASMQEMIGITRGFHQSRSEAKSPRLSTEILQYRPLSINYKKFFG